MLLAKQLQRVFIFNDNGQEIKLADPEPAWSEQAVLQFYSNTYPILTTAKISGPDIQDATIEYHFDSVIGTKG